MGQGAWPSVFTSDWVRVIASSAQSPHRAGSIVQVMASDHGGAVLLIMDGAVFGRLSWAEGDRWELASAPDLAVPANARAADPHSWEGRPEPSHPQVVDKAGFEGVAQITGPPWMVDAIGYAVYQQTLEGVVTGFEALLDPHVRQMLASAGDATRERIVALAQLCYEADAENLGFIVHHNLDSMELNVRSASLLAGLEAVICAYEELGCQVTLR